MTNLVFVHGWGMGPDIWTPVIKHLPGHSPQRADLGFHGSKAIPLVNAPFVITHSLGLMWALTHLPRPWAGLIALNGFTRFSRQGDFPGIEPRLLARMKARLPEDTTGVVVEFLRRCGMNDPNIRGLDQEMLSQGLDWLKDWDLREQFSRLQCPVLAVAGTHDPIVTQGHTRASFTDIPLIMQQGAGHLLPLTHAEWVANRIQAALKGDWSA